MPDALPLRYEPAGPVTEAFFASEAFVRAIMGPIGSGKSTVCVFGIVTSILRQRPSPRDGVRRVRWAIIRNTYPELRTTTMQTWWTWVPQSIGAWRDEGPPTHRLTLDLGARLGRAELEVLFLALDKPDDVKKLLSLELTGAWINEAREVPQEVLQHLIGRVGRYPSMADGGATWSGILMDTNPPDTDHWWYLVFEEECPEGFALFKQPSGLSAAAENVGNLPAGYYERASRGQTKEWVQVYVHGRYGYSRDGQPVYPEYSDGLHCAPAVLEPIRGLPLIIGVDAGLTPAATIWQRPSTGQWRGLAELAVEDHGGVGARRFGRMLAQILRQSFEGLDLGVVWADPASQHGADQADGEQSWMQMLAAATELPVRAAPTNGLAPRLEAVREPLGRLIEGQPGLIISQAMPKLRKGFMSGYRYRRMKVAGSPRFEDKPEKNGFSHVHDSAQYALLGGGEYIEITGRAAERRRGRARVMQSTGGLEPQL